MKHSLFEFRCRSVSKLPESNEMNVRRNSTQTVNNNDDIFLNLSSVGTVTRKFTILNFVCLLFRLLWIRIIFRWHFIIRLQCDCLIQCSIRHIYFYIQWHAKHVQGKSIVTILIFWIMNVLIKIKNFIFSMQ